jgi:hypothetical protein
MADEKCTACIDKKVTDYQIYVDRALQKQDKKIETHETYLMTSVNTQNKRIDDFIENNAGGGSKKFEKVYDGNFTEQVTFDKPYTEFYVYFDCGGAEAFLTLYDNNNQPISYPFFSGAELCNYHLKLDGGILSGETLNSSYSPFEHYEYFPNSTGIIKIDFFVEEEITDNSELIIYAR